MCQSDEQREPGNHSAIGCDKKHERKANGYFPGVSRQLRLLVNDKGDNEMIVKAMHRSPGVCLPVKENPGNPHVGDGLMKSVRSDITSNGVSYLQMTSVGSHSTSRRKKKGGVFRKSGRKDLQDGSYISFFGLRANRKAPVIIYLVVKLFRKIQLNI